MRPRPITENKLAEELRDALLLDLVATSMALALATKEARPYLRPSSQGLLDRAAAAVERDVSRIRRLIDEYRLQNREHEVTRTRIDQQLARSGSGLP